MATLFSNHLDINALFIQVVFQQLIGFSYSYKEGIAGGIGLGRLSLLKALPGLGYSIDAVLISQIYDALL